jgi:hypothetical protein
MSKAFSSLGHGSIDSALINTLCLLTAKSGWTNLVLRGEFARLPIVANIQSSSGRHGSLARTVFEDCNMNATKYLCSIFMMLVTSDMCFALDSWLCTYPNFAPDKKPVTVTLQIPDKLVDQRLGGVPQYDILENNQYGVIAVDHYSKFDAVRGAVRIFSSTVIIDKTFGKFIYTVGEIGDEPGFRTGQCVKELQ